MTDEIQRKDILEKLDHNHITIVEKLATLTAVVDGVKEQVVRQNGNVARHEQSIVDLKIKDTAQAILMEGLKKDGEKAERKWGNVVNWILTILQAVVTTYLLIKFGLR